MLLGLHRLLLNLGANHSKFKLCNMQCLFLLCRLSHHFLGFLRLLIHSSNRLRWSASNLCCWLFDRSFTKIVRRWYIFMLQNGGGFWACTNLTTVLCCVLWLWRVVLLFGFFRDSSIFLSYWRRQQWHRCWYDSIGKIELKVWIVIFHDEFRFESIFCISFKSYDKHGRVLCTIVIDRLTSFQCFNNV
mgnify:CR=1 FL=1